MRILNPALARDLDSGAPVKLNLGCGPNRRPGYYGVDLVEGDGVDAVGDLNAGLPCFPDNSVEEIISRHTFEHIHDFLFLMREVHRVTRAGGKITITVPHYSNVLGFSDPTHVRFFGLYTMFYFVSPENQPRRKVPAFYTDYRFLVGSIFIDFYRETLSDKVIAKLLTPIVNMSVQAQHFYERRLSRLYHASEITYQISPDK